MRICKFIFLVQNGMADIVDSDSLLTINKTSAEDHGMTDDQDTSHYPIFNTCTPAIDVCSDTEYDGMDYNQQKEKSWGEHLTESLFNVSSLDEWESRSSKRISRPLSEDTSGLSVPRSKDYYSDGDYNRYTTDLSDMYHSENEIGSHPVIQTEEGTVVKLGRCKICSNDSYQMVCVHDEDNITQTSFECAEECPFQLHSNTDASYSSGATVPSARVSFDDSILTGFLRDEHPNPKIITHRWTHMPYIKKSDQIPKENFMSESASCDDRFLRSPESSPSKTINSSKRSVDKSQNDTEKLCSRTSLHDDNKKKETSQADLELNNFENPPNTVKPVGLVAPIMAPLPTEQQDEDTTPPVALAESIDELCDFGAEEDDEIHDTLKTTPIKNNTIVTSKTPDGNYKTSLQLNVSSQPIKTVQENEKLPRLYENHIPNIPTTITDGKDSPSVSRLPIYPHSTTGENDFCFL